MNTPLVLAAAASLACLPPGVRAEPADVMLEVRQVVIRAPELEVAELLAAPVPKNGAELFTRLRQAVQAGRAAVLADMTSAADTLQAEARQGRYIWLVSGRDQDFVRLYLPPTSFEEFFLGASLEARLGLSNEDSGITGVSASWKASCGPCSPAMTRWPTSWLRPLTRDYQPAPQRPVIRGWLDNYDVFTETLVGEHWFGGSDMQLLGVAPPADQTWPDKARPGRWLDVFLGQIKPQGAGRPFVAADVEKKISAPPPSDDLPAAPFAGNPAARTSANAQVMLYGIGLDAREAALLAAERQPAEDQALLQRLLARVRQGGARLHVCVGTASQRGCRGTVTAVRQHQHPTEMPSIPSAWQTRAVGTVLEIDDRMFSLHHDLAPPRRTVWRLALDDPKAVMWEPRFRSLKITSSFPKKHGAQLVGLQRIPDVMKGDGIPGNETLLLFAQRQDDTPGPKAEAQPPAVEAELIVFEVPDASPADFKRPPEDPFTNNDDALFEGLLKRLKAQEASVAAHVLASTLPGRRNVISTAEEIMYATEFDPPDGGMPRMRPTALEVEHAGDLLEIEMAVQEPLSKISTRLSFTHSTGIPVEASLETALAFAAKDELMRDYPAPEHPRETWSPAEMSLEPGRVVFLGARKPPGIQHKGAHVAFLRVRKLP